MIDIKTKLFEYGINYNSLFTNTLFNYPSFLKYLNTFKFIYFVEMWLHIAIRNLNLENRLYDSEENIMRSVYMSLFKIFINEVNLHTLEIEISGHEALINTIELISKNQNFIQNVRNLKLYIKDCNDNKIINNHILQVIHSHRNLKKISIDSNNLSLYQSLLLSKNYNCSNTLNTIIFFNVQFKLITNLDKQIINSTKPFKLKSLILYEVPQIETLQQLLQKSGNYLENFGGYEREISADRMINFIENIKQSLNYLLINIWGNETICNSIILKNLGQILPSKLDYISLDFTIKESDFRVFLENSQDAFINKSLIRLEIGSDNILHYIKEYIMKKKRVKYLAIMDCNKKKELFDLKDEVREFELHNIKVRRYSDLDINVYDFIKNID
ncbi:hypothetical protein RhiirA1_449788 [Rhizophagus irregularis]|uniref:Uncharacterized protein n=1 Tax=Rhizophagus irregularis TaxID=588596 RepID=A0A2I1EYD5_9GLOM|nr:hypothetical protein RhiirA1_449788 [Rhizophagus irregularis]PKY27140.1 hypothetical protein RhiirB3_442732 [Rhizophagus irregularis]